MPVPSALRLAACLVVVSGGLAARAADLPGPARDALASPATAVISLPPDPPPLERSRYTGQPITVIYNDATRRPGSIDPGYEIVPLPSVKAFHTRAVYPRGY